MSDLVTRAADFARKAHDGQTRAYSNAPYFTHPERVAKRVAAMGEGPAMVAAAYLHDVVEDCGVDIDEINETFGFGVSRIVDCLTVRKIPGAPRDEQKRADRRKRVEAMPCAQRLKLVERPDDLTELRPDMKHSAKAREFAPTYCRESVALLTAIGSAHEGLSWEIVEVVSSILSAD